MSAITTVPQTGTITVSSGTGTATIVSKHMLVRHILVKATTSTTSFDVKLTDINDLDVLIREDNVGELSEMIAMPAYGNFTLTVSGSSADEDFSYVLGLQM